MQAGGSVLSTESSKGHAAAPTPPDPATTPGVWGALLLPMGLFLTWVVTPQNKRGVAHPLPEINLPPPLRDPVRYWPPRLIGVYWPKFQVTKAASTANVTRKAPNWAPPRGRHPQFRGGGRRSNPPHPKKRNPQNPRERGTPPPTPLTFRHRQVHACLAICRVRAERRAPPRRHEGGEFYPGVDPPFIQRDPQFELGRKMITGVHIKFCLETTIFPNQKVGG